MKKSIQQLLRSVKNEQSLGKLTNEAKALSWNRIMKEIDTISAPSTAPSVFDYLRAPFHGVELRPVFSAFSVFAAFCAVSLGWVGSVFASMNSVPGDTLYGLKLAAERAQLTFADSDESRARLHVEFANRRAEEVSELLENKQGNKERVKAAMGSLKTELKTVADHLSSTENKQDAMALAKLVDRKVENLKEAIESNLDGAEDAVKLEAEEVKGAVKVASVQALTVLVHEDVKTPDAAEQLEKKVSARVLEVRESLEKTLKDFDGTRESFSRRTERLPIMSEKDRKVADELKEMKTVFSDTVAVLDGAETALVEKDFVSAMKIAQSTLEALEKTKPKLAEISALIPSEDEPKEEKEN